MRTEDGCIIQECFNGKPEAFGMLVDKYKAGVYAFVYGRLGHFQDAQDVTQEVFEEAYRGLHSLRRWESFVFWIYRIARNLCVDWVQAESRRPDSEFISDQAPGVLESPSLDSYRQRYTDESLREALDALPGTYREVLILHYFGGMSIKDMAKAIGASPGAIGMRLSRARAQLREEMVAMMDTAFEGQRLQASFTFRIVEAVKRIKINPTPRLAGVPWALSLAMGIIITVLSLNPQMSIPRDMAIPTGSPLPVERRALKTGEIPVDILSVARISAISSKQEDGSIEDTQLPNPQNALLMAPNDEEAADVKLIAEDVVQEDYFGYSVDIYGDYAIMGAHGRDAKTGVAYIFKRHGTSWEQEAKLTAKDGVEEDRFGHSVAIYGDYAIMGAGGNDSGKGAAYIFKRHGTSWKQQTKLIAKDGAKEDYFGSCVAISDDYAVVGAPWDDDKDKDTGSVYFFMREGDSWSEAAKFTPHGHPIDHCNFGGSIDISGDYVIVGSVYENWASGAAYIFHYDGNSWDEEAKFTAKDNARQDRFGSAVSMDGDYAIVGAIEKDKRDGAGSAYIFKREGAAWTEQAKISASDGSAWDFFGISVYISGDYAIIGSTGDDDKGQDSGSIYTFVRSGTSWKEVSKHTPNDSGAEDYFGHSVSASGDYAIVGAWMADANGLDSGAVYIRNLKDLSLPGKAVEP